MSLATQTFSFLFSVVVVLFFSKKPGGISLSRAISDCGEWRGRKRERERSKFLVTTPLAAKHLSYYNDCSQVSSLFIFIPCRRQQSRSTIQQWDKFKPLSQLFCRWPQDPHLVLHAQSELNKKKKFPSENIQRLPWNLADTPQGCAWIYTPHLDLRFLPGVAYN